MQLLKRYRRAPTGAYGFAVAHLRISLGNGNTRTATHPVRTEFPFPRETYVYQTSLFHTLRMGRERKGQGTRVRMTTVTLGGDGSDRESHRNI